MPIITLKYAAISTKLAETHILKLDWKWNTNQQNSNDLRDSVSDLRGLNSEMPKYAARSGISTHECKL